MVELLWSAVFNKAVGQTYANHLRHVAGIGHKFQYGTAHASFNDTVFYRYDAVEPFSYFVQHLLVQRLQKTQVVMGDAEAAFVDGPFNGAGGCIADGS